MQPVTASTCPEPSSRCAANSCRTACNSAGQASSVLARNSLVECSNPTLLCPALPWTPWHGRAPATSAVQASWHGLPDSPGSSPELASHFSNCTRGRVIVMKPRLAGEPGCSGWLGVDSAGLASLCSAGRALARIARSYRALVDAQRLSGARSRHFSTPDRRRGTASPWPACSEQ